jgi:hypothetical protein
MSLASKLIGGFNKIISHISNDFSKMFTFFSSLFSNLFDFLEKPLALLYFFFEGVFYFFEKIYFVVVLVIKIFVACFQFVGALFVGLFRTISWWLNVSPTADTHFPSASGQGFETVIDIIRPTGLLTIVPLVALSFVSFYFVVKIVGLFGGSVSSPFGRD